MKNSLTVLAMALSMLLAACDFNGGVEQGRCVEFNRDANTVTMVVDTTLDQHNPHYSGKVDTFKLPTNPLDMGPEPEAGGCLMIEPEKNQLVYYDASSKSIRELPIEVVHIARDVDEKSREVRDKKFPVIDREKRTVTLYSPRLQELITFRVAEDDLKMAPYIFTLGNEVRIAFRKDMPGQAIRFMNVSKTSIFTR